MRRRTKKENSITQVVIGLGFGDEGKGLVTSYLASKADKPLVIRFSGGHQAGHTVIKDNVRHVFTNFGSGTLHGAPTYWSKQAVVDPIGIMNECRLLRLKCIQPELFINEKCLIVTPYDLHSNRENINTISHGTCGVGFGATLERSLDNHQPLYFGDLYHESVLKIKLDLIKEYYDARKLDLYAFYEAITFLKTYYKQIKKVESLIYFLNESSSINTLIYEGSQGLLLDQDYGFFPHVTRSNVGIKGVIKDTYLKNVAVLEKYYVTRAYQTRHGNGPMTNRKIEHNITKNSDETNITNDYQGRFRRTILDLDLLQYGLTKDRKENANHIWSLKTEFLIITCLDHLKEYKYVTNGAVVKVRTLDDFIHNIKIILNFDNILLSFSPTSDLTEWKK